MFCRRALSLFKVVIPVLPEIECERFAARDLEALKTALTTLPDDEKTSLREGLHDLLTTCGLNEPEQAGALEKLLRDQPASNQGIS